MCIKVCANCGKEFVPEYGRQKYCSIHCQNKMNTRKAAERYRAKHPQKTLVRTCPVCGKVFETHTSRKKYCSTDCAYTDGLRRKREGKVTNRTTNHAAYTARSEAIARRKWAADAAKAPCGMYPTCFVCEKDDCYWGGY